MGGTERITPADLPQRRRGPGGWGVAMPTERARAAGKALEPCEPGHRHASRLEARVCTGLAVWAAAMRGAYVLQQVCFPLLALAPRLGGRAHMLAIDFVFVAPDQPWRPIEAKPRDRLSRDWPARAAAFEAQYQRAIEYFDAQKVRTLWGK